MAHSDFRDFLPDNIQTKRLILRAPSKADVPGLARLANNENIHKMLARLPHPYSREHAVDFVENLARTDQEHAYAILLKDETFIGVAGLHILTGKPTELGYWLGEPYWGEGYASEAATALVHAADNAGCTELLARAKTANKASIAILLKAGFIQISEGINDCGQHKGVSVTHFEREQSK